MDTFEEEIFNDIFFEGSLMPLIPEDDIGDYEDFLFSVEDLKFLEEGSCGRNESDCVHIRTHKGSGSRMITLDMLREVGHLPQQQAANALKVGNTRFKTATRQLGMQSWPYRKIKSIRNLILVVQKNKTHFKGQADDIIRTLNELENSVFQFPMTPLNDEFKKFRQAAYKLNHKRNAPTRTGHDQEYSKTLKLDVQESTISEFSTDQYQTFDI